MENKENKEVIGTSDMPAPPIVDYSVMYKITPLFRNDLIAVIGNMAYCDVKRVTDILDINKNILSVSQLNDFIAMLGNLPYKTVHPLMRVIENKDNFNKYFSIIKN